MNTNTELDAVKVYTVPAIFYLDHRARDCGNTGKIIKQNKSTVTVELDAIALDDLLSDADYYADFKQYPEEYRENKSIVESAIRTLKTLTKGKI